MTDSTATDHYDASIAALDRLMAQYRSGRLTAHETAERLLGTIEGYFAGEDPRDDTDRFLAHALARIDELGVDPVDGDRSLSVLLRRRVEWRLDEPARRMRFDLLVADLDQRLAADDPDAAVELVDLCRSGLRSHQALFRVGDWALEVVALAHRHRRVDALVAVADPVHADRLGHPRRAGGRVLVSALDALAHLAAEPDAPTAAEARRGLLDLARSVELCGEAAVRLPVHLLDRDARAVLVELVARRHELTGDDPALDLPLVRDTRIVEGVAWLANDASRL